MTNEQAPLLPARAVGHGVRPAAGDRRRWRRRRGRAPDHRRRPATTCACGRSATATDDSRTSKPTSTRNASASWGRAEARDARALHVCEVSHATDHVEIERCKATYQTNKEKAAREGVAVKEPAAQQDVPSPEVMRRVKAITSAARRGELGPAPPAAPTTVTPKPRAPPRSSVQTESSSVSTVGVVLLVDRPRRPRSGRACAGSKRSRRSATTGLRYTRSSRRRAPSARGVHGWAGGRLLRSRRLPHRTR